MNKCKMDRREFIGEAGKTFLGTVGLVLGLSRCSPTYFLADDLYVNSGNTYEYAYLSREEGEKRLRKRAIDSDNEDAWFFFDVDKSRKSDMWVNIGWLTGTNHVLNLKYVTDELLEKVSSALDKANRTADVSFYHIHPIQAVVNVAYELMELKNKPFVMDNNIFECLSMPSYADIKTMISLDDRIEQYGLIPSFGGVVTPLGKFRYKVSQKMKDAYFAEGIDYLDMAQGEAAAYGIKHLDINAALAKYREFGLEISYERTGKLSKPMKIE